VITKFRTIVLHDQDRLIAARERCGRGFRRLGAAAGRGQIQPDRGAVTFLAVDLDVAAGLLDETIDHAEAET
jgi:hypothetical protein